MNEQASVLVVDDDLTVREVVGRYLERAGYRVGVAGDGTAALRAVQDTAPDLIVLDLMLPGLSGLEVCRQLRAGQHNGVAIVMLTALGEEEDRVVGGEPRSWGLGVAVEPDGWGMGGIGGSSGWWSEAGQYAAAFLTGHIGDHDRADRLENAVRAALALPPL